MHDDIGFVDDCLDLRRELQTSAISAGPMSLGENFVLLLYQTSDRIGAVAGCMTVVFFDGDESDEQRDQRS
jgi:hypothetical protein